MKKAYIISTGTELLLGSTIDSNSVYISQRLDDIGIKVIGKSTVGDNELTLRNAFKTGLELADIVISSGGLGPTFDDLTKKIACEIMDSSMEIIQEEAERLKKFFAQRHRPMPEINLKQAMFPPESIILKNEYGTAPGMYLNKDKKAVALLPGPPREMMPMYQNELEPLLKKDFGMDIKRAARKNIKVFGVSESQVEEMLTPILKEPCGCSLALLAFDGEIHIKVTAEGENAANSQEILDKLTRRITKLMGDYFFGTDDETLAHTVAMQLKAKGKKIAGAESCTGGWLSKTFTDLPGSSDYFWGSVISYSNEAKIKLLGVCEEILNEFGAVSEQTAREMAFGIIKQSGSDLGVAITGIAGPGGGTEEKPVGLVYVAVAEGEECEVRELRFVGSRETIRILSVKSALDLVRKILLTSKDSA